MFDVFKAKKLQAYLSKKVILKDNYSVINRIACVDASYSKNIVFAIAALFDYPSSRMLKYVVVKDIVNIPYVPGLLAFREAPFYIKALKRLGLNNIDLRPRYSSSQEAWYSCPYRCGFV